MSSHRIPQDEYVALNNGVFNVSDPGASGEISVGTLGRAICVVTTAGAETRTVEAAANLPVGTRLTVVFDTDGGDLTIDTDDTDVVLNDAGDVAEFIVTSIAGVHAWRSQDIST